MATPRPRETVVQQNCQAVIRRAGGWCVKIHGDPLQPRTVDIFAVYRGCGIGLETKRPGEGYSRQGSHRLVSDNPLQEYELQAIRDAGGWAAVVDDPTVVRDALAAWPLVCRMCLSREGVCDC